MTDTKALIAEALAWTIDWDGSQMQDGEPPRDGVTCILLRRLAAALEEAEKMTGALAVSLRVNAYRAGHSTEDVDKVLREIGYMPADTARAAMEALEE